jgi:capsular exopolysaccharide synthesis family protein
MDENKSASDDGVKWLKTTGEEQRRFIERADEEVLNFRVENKLDAMESQKRAVDSVLIQLNSDLARSEVEQSRAADLLDVLTEIQKDPSKISSLPEIVPRAQEIAAAQAALQNAITERDALLTRFTDKHPEVVQASSKVEVLRKQFLEAVFRARETAAANLELMAKQTASLRERMRENEKLSTELELSLIAAKSRLEQLERNREVAGISYRSTLMRIEEARQAMDDFSASIQIIEEASLPRRQISPDPRVAFTTGPMLGVLIGFVFILVLDRLEDRITSVADIERHMSTKVLAMIPRVPRIKRDQLVKLSADKKFSSFAEAFAGLRGVLSSPRYSDLTQVILIVSTQPEEGKTISSSNLAMTYAMSGKKTLLVDFDLRRPRLGRMFGVNSNGDRSQSLVDVLAAEEDVSFDTLLIPSGYDNLDLVMSRASTQISPATVMGSDALRKFFEWARANYEHVVIDSPPFGLVSDALALGTLSDSVILVCRPERSRYRAIRHALRSLTESGARVLGVVVNDVDFKGASFFSYSYSRNYGYNYYGKYGRYGRYGYGYGYYHRGIEDASSTQAESANGGESGGSDSGSSGDSRIVSSSGATAAESILDVEDDE